MQSRPHPTPAPEQQPQPHPDIDLESIIAANETAAVRNIGITFDARPDCLSETEIDGRVVRLHQVP